MPQDDELFFDNSDEDIVEPDAVEESDEGEAPNRGDLRVPLRQTRDELRQIKAELETERQLRKQSEQFATQYQQRYQHQPAHQQVDPNEYNERLQDDILNKPAELFNRFGNNIQQQTTRELMKTIAPVIKQSTTQQFRAHVEYGKLPDLVHQKVADLMDYHLATTGQIDHDAITEAYETFNQFAKSFGAPAEDKPKARPASTVGKGAKGGEGGEGDLMGTFNQKLSEARNRPGSQSQRALTQWMDSLPVEQKNKLLAASRTPQRP